jgi:hypothetical protein
LSPITPDNHASISKRCRCPDIEGCGELDMERCRCPDETEHPWKPTPKKPANLSLVTKPGKSIRRAAGALTKQSILGNQIQKKL